MTEEVAPALAQMLQGQQQLQVLNLNDTSLGEEGIVIIAEALQQSGGFRRAQDTAARTAFGFSGQARQIFHC